MRHRSRRFVLILCGLGMPAETAFARKTFIIE